MWNVLQQDLQHVLDASFRLGRSSKEFSRSIKLSTVFREIFSERLGPLETRETTWRRATLAGANNRLCRLLWTEDEFNGLSLASSTLRDQR